MIRIIKKSRLDQLEDIESKYRHLYTRVDQLYWLSSFAFMNNLTSWVKSGVSYCGRYYNCPINSIRDDFKKEVDDFYKNTLSLIQNENIELVKENADLRKTIATLRNIDLKCEEVAINSMK